MICTDCGRDWYAETRDDRQMVGPGGGRGSAMHQSKPDRPPVAGCPIHKTPLVHGYCPACFAHVRRQPQETPA